MYSVSVKAENIDPQIKALRRFEAYAEQHYKAAMRQVINPTKSAVKSAAPQMTGALRKKIGSSIKGTGSNITGRVTNGKDTWYGNVVEYGRYKSKKQPPVAVIAEKFGVPMNEAFLIARSIARSDAKARKPAGFFKGAREQAFRAAEQAFANANVRVVDEMSVK